MATRSTIAARKDADGRITAIYCHWDGYPAGVGATLEEHYTTWDKVDALMALGDLSVLGADIGSKKDFDFSVLNNECLAYGRDRGDVGVTARTYDTVQEWLVAMESNGCEYGYLWNGAMWETFELA